MPIVAGSPPQMSQADKDALIARLVKIASVGGSLLSNATAARKLAETIPVTPPSS